MLCSWFDRLEQAATCKLTDGKHCVTFHRCYNANSACTEMTWSQKCSRFTVLFFLFFTVHARISCIVTSPKIPSVSLFFLCLAQNFLCLPPLASRLAILRPTAPSLLVQRAKNTCHVGLLWTDWQQSSERGEMREAKPSFSVRYEIEKMYGSKSCYSFVLFCFTNNCAALLLICF